MDNKASAVYGWEHKNIRPLDRSPVKYEDIQGVIDFVWQNEGLEYPPQLETLRHDSKWGGQADRMKIWFKKSGTYTWVILHEVAHSMTAEAGGGNCGHNPRWLGVYVDLLVKYLGADRDKLILSILEEGLGINFKGKTVG